MRGSTFAELLALLGTANENVAPVPTISRAVRQELELPAFLGSRGIDTRTRQSLQVVSVLTWINDVDRFVATLEPVLDGRKQHTRLFFVTIEKRADVTRLAQMGSRKGDGDFAKSTDIKV
jgi:hypothetical protein